MVAQIQMVGQTQLLVLVLKPCQIQKVGQLLWSGQMLRKERRNLQVQGPHWMQRSCLAGQMEKAEQVQMVDRRALGLG
jgi:hypothetical protein